MRILAISGSLHRDSHNTALLRAAATLVPPGIERTLHDGLKEIPPYDDDDLDARPVAVARQEAEVAATDAVLISTPEYNSSISGQLKNALERFSSTGMFGAVWAQAETRKVLGAIGALTDAEIERQIVALLEALADALATRIRVAA